MANRRVSLAALADRAAITVPDPSPAPDEATAAVEPPVPGPTPGNIDPPAPASAATRAPAAQRRRAGGRSRAPAAGEWVRYDQLERKEARLRFDQYGRLTAASRNLNRARSGAGERITENTLIRVAIDLLLAREDDLVGATEGELRSSLGL